MVQTVRIVENEGDEPVEEVIQSTEFAVKIDGQIYKPAITTNVEIEHDGDTESTSDQCGHTTRQRTGDNGWVVRVQGIVTANDDRYGNLSLQMLRDVVAGAEDMKIRSDVIEGSYVVSNTVITQAGDLYSIQTQATDGEEQAFEFQVQFGESSSES